MGICVCSSNWILIFVWNWFDDNWNKSIIVRIFLAFDDLFDDDDLQWWRFDTESTYLYAICTSTTYKWSSSKNYNTTVYIHVNDFKQLNSVQWKENDKIQDFFPTLANITKCTKLGK